MDIWAVITLSFYFALHLIFYFGLKRSFGIQKTPNGRLPFISVITAARNEENNIAACIESLKKIKYHKDCYEIILVNDSSTDRTEEIINERTKGHSEFKILNTADVGKSLLTGKTRALAFGIRHSRGELIMMTDADCTVTETWLSDTAKYFSAETGMICGFTKIDYRKGLFSKLQALDWIYLQALASASSGINNELSCIGNNLSFSRTAFESFGGYEGLKFSVTEDLALLRKIKSLGNYDVKYPVDDLCLVTTQPCADIKELYKQKKRWFRGGTGINFLGYLLGVLLYSVNIILVFGLIFLSPQIYAAAVIIKMISESLIMLPVYKKLKYTKLAGYFIPFQIYFAAYGLLLPFTFITGYKIDWKGRNH